jgi:tetratricopeptide (TPR) repeat protein
LLSFSLHPGGRLLAVVLPAGLGFFDLLTREEVGFVSGNFGRSLRFDSTGALWTTGGAGLVRWPVRASGTSSLFGVGPPHWVADVLRDGHDGFSVSDDGRIATVPLYSSGARVVHLGPPRRTFRLGPQRDVRKAPVSPDGQWVVTATHGYERSGVRHKLWAVDTGRCLAGLPASEAFSFHGFSPDGRWLRASRERGGGVRRLEIALLRERGRGGPSSSAALPWQDEPNSEANRLAGTSSPDRRLLASGTDEGGLRLVEAETNNEVARFPAPPEGRIAPHGFSPDGSLLAAGGEKGALYVFDLVLIRTQLAELGLDWDDVQPLPRRSKAFDPTRAEPLRVELIEAESAASQESLAEAERRRAVARLSSSPHDAEAHFRLGRSLYVTGQYHQAHTHLSKALALAPDLEEALSLRAQVAWRQQFWDEAVTDAGRYLAKVPFDTPMRLLRARSNRARKRYQAAVADYTTLRGRLPGWAVICDERAECYEALGKRDLATTDRQQSKKLGGGGLTLNNEAWKLVTGPVGQRDPARALELVRKALEHEPENGTYLNTLGVVQYRNGMYKEAVDTLEKSLIAGGGGSDAHDLYFLAMCHSRLGDRAKAKECFDRAVRWRQAQKGLPVHEVEELKAFRAEAEQLLGSP